MKKLLACTVMIGAMAAPSLLAIPSSGSVNVSRTPGYYSGSGGEFTITSTTASFAAFQTFCLEMSEPVGGNPHTYQLNAYDAAVLGGANSGAAAPDNGDPISLGTAYLYEQFRLGTWTDYDYNIGAGRVASAGHLQNAIWWLEDELGLATPLNNPFLKLLDDISVLAGWKADNNGTYAVTVMNMTAANGARAQDFLALSVPDGGLTVALLGMGLAGLGWFNRRIRR